MKTGEIEVKWPSKWACDMVLESSFQGYNFAIDNSSIIIFLCRSYELTNLQDS
jgi:hypothetical protein